MGLGLLRFRHQLDASLLQRPDLLLGLLDAGSDLLADLLTPPIRCLHRFVGCCLGPVDGLFGLAFGQCEMPMRLALGGGTSIHRLPFQLGALAHHFGIDLGEQFGPGVPSGAAHRLGVARRLLDQPGSGLSRLLPPAGGIGGSTVAHPSGGVPCGLQDVGGVLAHRRQLGLQVALAESIEPGL